jgi:anti-sigma regulatory factor (Ser/Thr protein kinase)
MTARARFPLVLELSRTSRAPGIARRWLAESFGEDLDGLVRETAQLLISELVTNAIVHGQGRVEVHAELNPDRLIVEVSDEGPGFTSTVRERDPNTAGGCGLRIVEKEASRWGICEDAAEVWFELPRHPAGSTGDPASTLPEHRVVGCERAKRPVLYRRVADTLERSADLAAQHPEHERQQGRQQSVNVELDRAKRAREAASLCRALCSYLS